MSRGSGLLQRTLFTIIRRHGKPMMFDDMRAIIRQELDLEDGIELSLSFERLVVSQGSVSV
jgi:hypothetical protein